MKLTSYLSITPHPNYIYPSRYEIQQALDIIGYDYYFPKVIFDVLIALCSYSIRDIDVKPIIQNSCFPEEMKEFCLSLELNSRREQTKSVLFEALFILKMLTKEYNLRQLEMGKVERNSENFVNKTKTQVTSLNENDELSYEEQAKVLKFYELFRKMLPAKIETTIARNQRMLKSYGEILKVKSKTSFVRPDMLHKLVTKQLQVNGLDEILDTTEVIFYLEDASSSMNKGNNYLASKALQLILCDDPRPVYYCRFTSKVEIKFLGTQKEKIKAFSEPKEYYFATCDFFKLFQEINILPHTGNVIISTDGEDIFNPRTVTKHRVYAISHSNNRELSNFCKKTEGQFLII